MAEPAKLILHRERKVLKTLMLPRGSNSLEQYLLPPGAVELVAEHQRMTTRRKKTTDKDCSQCKWLREHKTIRKADLDKFGLQSPPLPIGADRTCCNPCALMFWVSK